ncbi:hypothetical protein NUM3379_42340 [Kineococcus sp. NUM-3379]
MRIGSVTSAPNVYSVRETQHIQGITPVARVNANFTDEDPLDFLTQADRALLAHLQAGVVDLDRSEGTAIAHLAKEISYVRAAGIIPGDRPLTDIEIGILVQQALSHAVRPMAPETHSRMTAYVPRGRSVVRLDVVL